MSENPTLRAHLARPVGVALLSVVLAGCPSFGEDGPTAPTQVDPAGPPPTFAGVDLPARSPRSVFVARGFRFGALEPDRAGMAAALAEDPQVVAAETRLAFPEGASEATHEVTAIQVDVATFADEASIQVFASALAGQDAVPERRAGRTVHVAPQAASALVDDVVVVVEGPSPVALLDEILLAVDVGVAAAAGTETPLGTTDPAAVFPRLDGIRFPPPGPEGPAIETTPIEGAAVVERRLLVVADEVRGSVQATALDPAVVPTAEAALPLLHAAVVGRARATDATGTVVAGTGVIAADGDRAVRGFRVANVLVLVTAAEPALADGVTAAWLTAGR